MGEYEAELRINPIPLAGQPLVIRDLKFCKYAESNAAGLPKSLRFWLVRTHEYFVRLNWNYSVITPLRRARPHMSRNDRTRGETC